MRMDISVHYIPFKVRRRLSHFLEPVGGIGLCGWKLLMEELGYPPLTIGFTTVAPRSPDETNTELVMRTFAKDGGTVGRLLEALEQIKYLDALHLLLESLPAIRRIHEAQSIENQMGYYSGEDVLEHLPGYGCRQLHEAMPSQGCRDKVQRPHAAQPQHPGSQNCFSYDDRGDHSMAAQASHISSMDTEDTMIVTDGCEEYPIAMANVQLRDCNGIDDLMATPLESRSPLLSGTSPCDRNNNDSELKSPLSPSRDIKPDKSVLFSTQTEQQNRPFTQSSFIYSTAAETRENVTTETVPKKEEQNRTSCCIEQYKQDHELGVDVRPKIISSFPWRPDNIQPVTVVEEKPRVSHERPLQILSNGIRPSGKKRPSIFVTYVHDDDRHRKRVFSLMQFLISNGFSACADLCENGTEDRPGKLCRLKQFVFVLFCISPDYKKAVGGHRNENNNNKYLNAREIHQMMEEEYHNINKNTPPFTKRRYRSIPVLFTDSKARPRDIPDWLKNCGPVYEWPEHHRHLAFYLSRPESCFDDPLDTKSCITQSVTPC